MRKKSNLYLLSNLLENNNLNVTFFLEKTYIFKNDQYWKFENQTPEKGYPKKGPLINHVDQFLDNY